MIQKCDVGTLVHVGDGTCLMVENFRHAWCDDGTCANCGKTRKEAGYSMKTQNTFNKPKFMRLLRKAAVPSVPVTKGKSSGNDSNSGKRTRQRKPANTSD